MTLPSTHMLREAAEQLPAAPASVEQRTRGPRVYLSLNVNQWVARSREEGRTPGWQGPCREPLARSLGSRCCAHYALTGSLLGRRARREKRPRARSPERSGRHRQRALQILALGTERVRGSGPRRADPRPAPGEPRSVPAGPPASFPSVSSGHRWGSRGASWGLPCHMAGACPTCRRWSSAPCGPCRPGHQETTWLFGPPSDVAPRGGRGARVRAAHRWGPPASPLQGPHRGVRGPASLEGEECVAGSATRTGLRLRAQRAHGTVNVPASCLLPRTTRCSEATNCQFGFTPVGACAGPQRMKSDTYGVRY